MPSSWPVVSERTLQKAKEHKEQQLIDRYDLNEKSAAVLRSIIWSRGETSQDVCKDLDMPAKSVSGIIGGLVRKGLVKKDDNGRFVYCG